MLKNIVKERIKEDFLVCMIDSISRYERLLEDKNEDEEDREFYKSIIERYKELVNEYDKNNDLHEKYNLKY